jgi:hypothetical protein
MKIKLILFSLILCYLNCQTINLTFEYPYTCGTWFNRGKNTCNLIREKLEQNNLHVLSTVKPYKMGIFPPGYNGEFNIYLNKHGKKILLATSDSRSPNYQVGLKYFAYTFFRIDEKTGEKNYLEEFPQKNELLEYVLKRTVEVLKSQNFLKYNNN